MLKVGGDKLPTKNWKIWEKIKKNEDGTINLNQYKYVSVDNNVLEKANEIVKYQSVFLRNSVLPESQIEKIVQN